MLQVCAFLAFAVKLVASRFCGRESNENRIKQLTGGDPLTARFMRQDLFTFMPTHKLFIVGNNQPKLIKVDDVARQNFSSKRCFDEELPLVCVSLSITWVGLPAQGSEQFGACRAVATFG